VTSLFAVFVSHRSSAFLQVNRLSDFVTQLTGALDVGSLVSCHNFLSLFFSFNSRSKPGCSVLTSESVTFLVDNLYAKAMEAVKSQAALSASIPVLISSLGDINSEAMF
jgi:predicted transcriptional regulator YheO